MKHTLLITLILLLLAACAAPPEAAAPQFDIRGEWKYTMTSSDGNLYDEGTITFSGQPQAGTYQQLNFYEIAYEGGYVVNGASVRLGGHETWEGAFTDADTLSGNWVRDDGSTGTFTANRGN